ncbi:MAG: hypothetical protein E7277_07025 [Lachnospiraceae bacterium]|jgi:hypothetical protein|nr:hypothetical protein [Lachnospiraceae bacterium]
MEYLINPIKMGGLVKEVSNGMIKVHLHGRLGVICVPEKLIQFDEPLEPGVEMEFYFSYIEVIDNPYDYDCADMVTSHEISPCLLGGKIIEVNDTAAKIAIMNQMGTIAVPRRWMFTPVALEVGQDVQFYFSCMNVVGKRDIPVESI